MAVRAQQAPFNPSVEPTKLTLHAHLSKNVTVRFPQSALLAGGYAARPAIFVADGGALCGVRQQELLPDLFPKERGAEIPPVPP